MTWKCEQQLFRCLALFNHKLAIQGSCGSVKDLPAMQSAGWLTWLLLDEVMLVDPNFRRRLADFIRRQVPWSRQMYGEQSAR
jgi:hypothetical protein